MTYRGENKRRHVCIRANNVGVLDHLNSFEGDQEYAETSDDREVIQKMRRTVGQGEY